MTTSLPRDSNHVPAMGGISTVDPTSIEALQVNPATGGLIVEDSSVAATTTTLLASYNVTLTSADTEYSQVLPDNTKRFTVQSRSSDDIRFAFVTGKVASPTAPYFTLKTGQNYYESNLDLDSKTLYLASSSAGVIVEILIGT